MKRSFSTVLAILTAFAAHSAFAETPAQDSWDQISDDDGIKVWSMDVPKSDVVAFRGEAVVDASIAKVAAVLSDTSRKLEWVAKIEAAKDVKIISSTERVEYNHTGTPWPLTDRDFVFHAKADLDKANGTMILRLKSVNDPAMPPQKDKVRGRIYNSQYTLKMLSPSKTLVTVEIHADPMGSVPKSIVNLFQKSWPSKTLKGIQKQAAKPDVKELPEVKNYFEGT